TKLFTDGVELVMSGGQLWAGVTDRFARVPLSVLHRAADGESVLIEPKMFGALDGLSGRNGGVSPGSLNIGSDGRVWILTANGIAVGDPTDNWVNRTVPQVHVEDVTVGGAPTALSEGGTLPPNLNRLAIHFSAPMLGLPERGRVEYRLDG